jgi:hypothetical protein
MRERLDSSCITASSQRMTSGGLVIVGTMEIIVPLIVVLAIGMISILATILNPVASIHSMKKVLKDFSTLTLVMLIQRERSATSRVPSQALAMVGVLTSLPASWV